MRFLDGLFAIGIWVLVMIGIFKMGVVVILSTAIVFAGAMAGGD